MKKLTFVTLALLLAVLFVPKFASAHCQVPCGIYDDSTRFDLMNEHVTTIEKSMNQINELSADMAKNANQVVRWVNNKEDHADQFTEIVTYYFLAQRIKVVAPDNDHYAAYQKNLELLHQMIVTSMKCKQTTDLANVEKLRSLIKEFETSYFSH